MNLKKKFYSQYLLVWMFTISIVFMMVVGLIVQTKNIIEYRQEIEALEKEIGLVENKIDKIGIDEFETEEERLEFLARTKLGMVKRNEIIYLER